MYPGKRYLNWKLDDPAGLPIEKVRPIVNEIDRRVQASTGRVASNYSSIADSAGRSSAGVDGERPMATGVSTI